MCSGFPASSTSVPICRPRPRQATSIRHPLADAARARRHPGTGAYRRVVFMTLDASRRQVGSFFRLRCPVCMHAHLPQRTCMMGGPCGRGCAGQASRARSTCGHIGGSGGSAGSVVRALEPSVGAGAAVLDVIEPGRLERFGNAENPTFFPPALVWWQAESEVE
jgi:hypothetical protein